MKYAKSELCQLGWLSCMGCCGHHMKDKLSVAKGIEKNTLEFHRYRKEQRHPKEWMNRTHDLRESGICTNLIYDTEKDRIYCPLHPELNSGNDLRSDHRHCDILHVCKTAFFFDLWDDERKGHFIKFIKTKKKNGELDWYTYSTKMNDGTLMEEFEGLKW
jgi:hypothetical protein